MNIEDLYLINSFYKLPVKIECGKGPYVYDINGEKYLDFMCGYGVALLGHGHPAIIDAIKSQIEKIITVHSSLYSKVREEFLGTLFNILPSYLNKCFLTNSGSEAIELAFKLVRKFTKKRGIISMLNSYHGKTMGALSLTGKEKYRKAFEPLVPGVKYAEYGNVEDLKNKIDNEVGGVILEPIQGEAGVIIPKEDYLKAVREICDDKNLLLILDEIQTGLGRTGSMFYFEQKYIEPDILCIGKGLAGGLPVGCVITRKEIANSMNIGEHTSTFSASPLVCAVAKKVLEEIHNNKIYLNAKYIGEKFINILNEFCKYNIINEIRGIGLMIAIEFKIDIRNLLLRLLRNHMLTCYTSPNIIRFLPPLNISEKEIKEAYEKIEKTLENYGSN